MMDNVSGYSIKIDMPLSQYGTLEFGGRLYNVHVSNIQHQCYETFPEQFEFKVTFFGERAVEPEPTWADSYETI